MRKTVSHLGALPAEHRSVIGYLLPLLVRKPGFRYWVSVRIWMHLEPNGSNFAKNSTNCISDIRLRKKRKSYISSIRKYWISRVAVGAIDSILERTKYIQPLREARLMPMS